MLSLTGGRAAKDVDLYVKYGTEAPFGNVLDEAVKSRLGTSRGFKGMVLTGRGKGGPDIWNPRTLRGWDITTRGNWPSKLDKYIDGTAPLSRPPISPLTGERIELWRQLIPVIY
jgi:hypothetical protein